MKFDFERAFREESPYQHGATCSMIAYAIYRIDLFHHVDEIFVYTQHDIRMEIEGALRALRIEYVTERKGTRTYLYRCVADDGTAVNLHSIRRSRLTGNDAQSLRGRRPVVFIDHHLWLTDAVSPEFRGALSRTEHFDFRDKMFKGQ